MGIANGWIRFVSTNRLEMEGRTGNADMVGGKLLDQGHYGCIFTSSLYCKNNKRIPHSERPALTKLSLKEDAEQEYSVARMIRAIPLWKNYFEVAESICIPAARQPEPDLRKCDVLKRHRGEEWRLLSMTHRGKALRSFSFDMKRLDFMQFITHLVEAGALLCKQGIVHRDLHVGNIVVDQHYVPRIIDFGLSVTEHSPHLDSLLRHVHSLSLLQESPDYTMINAFATGYTRSRMVHTLSNKKNLKKMESILGIRVTHDLTRLSNMEMIVNGDFTTWFHTYWTKVDSWAIGSVIFQLLIQLSVWPVFVERIEGKKGLIIALLRKMCEIHPDHRIDCIEALRMLQPTHAMLRDVRV